jgi:LysR family transcriptional regulator, transcriptional activator of nhaA
MEDLRNAAKVLENHQLNFKHLFYFHVVAEEGSLTKAARRLSLTEPSISEQIKKLETVFGRRLFDRTHAGLRLNEAGNTVFAHTSVMFRASERLARAFGPPTADTPEVLEIGIAGSVGRSFAADYFYPLLTLEHVTARIHVGDDVHLVRELLGRELDVVLTDNLPARAQSRRLKTKVVQRPQLVAVATDRFAVDLAEFPGGLSGKRFIHYTRGSRYRWEIEQYFEREHVDVQTVGEADDVALQIQAVLQDLCFAIVPRGALRGPMAHNGLKVLGTLQGVDSSVYALYHEVATPELISKVMGLLERPLD